jgi:hypothetical protein
MVTVTGGISGNRQVPLTSELRYFMKYKKDLISYLQSTTSFFCSTRVYYGMTKTNKTTTASFWSRTEAIAYRDGIRMLSDLYPEQNIRVSGPWEAEIENRKWRVYVECFAAC